ncbi:Zinc finger BED domain-containing protein 4 [Labeo rohita]|uniref:Zinc finger BED domain-containing protein 4 n=1 Tax=Labeo rohita TaxID=84645 RepID=A0ABQ8L4I6_LABRO|nr:Zinc finger BED domain-containing protein 4 [Labeo rohita]
MEEAPDIEIEHPWPYLSEFFEVVERKNESFIFKCLLCLPQKHTISSFKNSPSNLKKHIERKHSSHLERYSALTAPRKRKAENPVPSTSRQLKLGETKIVNQTKVDNVVINFVIQSLQPFTVLEQPAFNALVQELQPNSRVMSRTTLRRKVEEGVQEMNESLPTGCSVALACRRIKGPHTFDVLGIRTTTDNGSNFIKAFREYGEQQQDENNNCASSETEEDACSDENEQEEEGVDVDFIEVTPILMEDDGLQFQLPKHHRCACHLLNLVATVDAAKANSNDSYKRLSRSAFAKCSGLWNKTSRSSTASDIIEETCKIQLIRPNDTRWNSLFLSVERIVRIIKDEGEGALRTVCTALKLPMLSSVEISFLEEFARTMGPLAKALNILQDETDVQMGWLLPTLTLLINKLERIHINSRYCKPLVDAVLEGLQKRFKDMMAEPEFIAAAILLPKFKTAWTSDENLLNLGPSGGRTSTSVTRQWINVKQLEGYLASKVDNKEILQSYPAVCKLSLKINTALPASAACERLFSTAGLIFSPRRARLDARNFENQLLLKLNKKYFSFR